MIKRRRLLRLEIDYRARADSAVRVLLDDVPSSIALDALRAAGFDVAPPPPQLPQDVISELSPGQRRVLDGILRGQSAAEIAAALGRSIHTVNNHTRAIFSTLGVHTRAQAIVRCVSLRVDAIPAPLKPTSKD